jgi:putative cell wall-binding protein
MVRRRRITSLALSTLAIAGGLAAALPASASAAVVAQTQTLTPGGIFFLPGVNPSTGVATAEIYLGTEDVIGTNAMYTVDWGDGTTSSKTGVPAPTWQAPLWVTHTYTAQGVYKVVVNTLAGGDRYATAVAVAARYAAVTGHAPTRVGLASGAVFPDALSGGAYAAKIGMPLVLTDPQTLSPETAGYLAGLRQAKTLQWVEIFGGPNAVSPAIGKLLMNW